MPNPNANIVIGAIIKSERFKESDLRITALTPHGKTTLYAKGTTKPTSKLKGALQLFNLIEFTTIGQNITGAHIITSNIGITRDINRYNLACYVCQTSSQVQDHSSETFALLIQTLGLLADTEVSCFKIYIWFYSGLLQNLGFGIEEFTHSPAIEKFTLTGAEELDTIPLTLSIAKECISAIIKNFAEQIDIKIPKI